MTVALGADGGVRRASVSRDPGAVWCFLVGAGEVATGLALLAAPTATFRLLGLASSTGGGAFSEVSIRFVGAFVLGVGGILWLPLRLAPGPGRALRIGAALEATAVVRSVIAAFVATSVVAGALAPTWWLVAVYDGGVALLQVVWLGRKDRFGEVRR